MSGQDGRGGQERESDVADGLDESRLGVGWLTALTLRGEGKEMFIPGHYMSDPLC